MRKVWTRLATVVLILVVGISFSACSLFTTDLDKKYSADVMVASAANDSSISISRQELYYGYLQWGYQYADYYKSSEELLEYIASALLNSKVLEKQSIEKFGELQPSEEALALQRAYNSLNESLRSDIYKTLDIEDEKDDEAEQESEDEVDKPYSPSVLVSLENGERVFTLDLSSYQDEEGTGLLSPDDYQYFVPTIPAGTSMKNLKQAISKVVRNLQSLEKGFTKLAAPARDYLKPNHEAFAHLSTAERNVLNREIDRMVKSNKTSILSERFNVAYNLGFNTLSGNDAVIAWRAYLERGRNFDTWCEMINGKGNKTNALKYFGCGRAVATNMANDAIDYYKQKVIDAINYQKISPDSELETSLMSSLADVYYIPQEIANNLFTVSHILIGYTDEQKEEVKTLQEEETNNPEYTADLDKIRAKTMSDGKTADKIFDEVKAALNKADSLDAKCKIFREYINKYNSDPGMQNLEQLGDNSKPKYEYVMNVDNDKNKMVAEFNEGSLKLFKENRKGDIEMVWTEYGAHIIMYTRDVGDFIFTGSKDAEAVMIEELSRAEYPDKLFTTLTSYGKRTLFDTLIDAYFTRSVNNYRSGILKDYKSEHEITIYDNELKNFF